MKQKAQAGLAKVTSGECARIVAVGEPSGVAPNLYVEGGPAGVTDDTWPTHRSPALAKLDDPIVRGHLRDAFQFLGTMKLHYCANCDEEWPVFAGDWPQGGAATAGSLAGKCETIARWVDGLVANGRYMQSLR